jgi:hypothetical protein
MLPSNLFSFGFGGAQRMLNNNTLICAGWIGIFIEVTPDKQIVWTYINPYPYQYGSVYRTQYIPPYIPEPIPNLDCSGTLSWTDVEPGGSVNGTITVENIGETYSHLDWEIESYPEWGTWSFNPDSGIDLLAGEYLSIDVEVIAPDDPEQTFADEVVLVSSENTSDTCVIDVSLTTPVNQHMDMHPLLQKKMEQFPNVFPLLRQLLRI